MAVPKTTRSPVVDSTPEFGAFVQMLDAQLHCYRQLRSLVERQSRLVSAGDIARLLGVLAERQKITQKVSDLAQSILPWRTKWPETRQTCPAADRLRAERLLQEIGDAAQAIVRQDENDAMRLRARKSSVAQSLHGLQTGNRAAHAYAGGGDTRASRTYTE